MLRHLALALSDATELSRKNLESMLQHCKCLCLLTHKSNQIQLFRLLHSLFDAGCIRQQPGTITDALSASSSVYSGTRLRLTSGTRVLSPLDAVCLLLSHCKVFLNSLISGGHSCLQLVYLLPQLQNCPFSPFKLAPAPYQMHAYENQSHFSSLTYLEHSLCGLCPT